MLPVPALVMLLAVIVRFPKLQTASARDLVPKAVAITMTEHHGLRENQPATLKLPLTLQLF